MLKKLFTFVSVFVLSMGTMEGCQEKTIEPEEVVYLEESQITDFFKNPNAYKGKYIKLSGEVFSIPQNDEQGVAVQVWHDISNFDQDFIAYTDNIEGIKKNDYVVVDGKIEGTLKGTSAFGREIENPLIVDAKVTETTYMDVITPTLAEITPAASQDQNGIVVTVDKVEYAEQETRVYVTIKNNTEYNFTCGPYSAKLVINGQQIDRNRDSMTMYKTPELHELSYEVMAKTSASGTIIFPVIEQNQSFQFLLPESHSKNYDLKFDNYLIDVDVNAK